MAIAVRCGGRKAPLVPQDDVDNIDALGITGGLVPSAPAHVILLAAISLQRIGFGIASILAFGIGMAGVLAGIGLALVYVRAALERI